MVTNSAQFEDERLRILRLVEDGRISASEGISLLNALNGERKQNTSVIHSAEELPHAEIKVAAASDDISSTSAGPRWFKVRVTDIETGRAKTSVTLPLRLVDWGLRIGARYAPDTEIDMAEVGEMLRMGIEGKLIDVLDEEDGEHVEIFIE